MKHTTKFLFIVLCLGCSAFILLSSASTKANRPNISNKEGHGLRRPIALALADESAHLLIANRDSGTIAILDTRSRKIATEISIGERLSDLTATADGKVIFVTDEKAHELIELMRTKSSLRIIRRRKTSGTPVSVATNRDGSLASVAYLWSRRLTIFAKQQRWMIDLPFAPRGQLLLAEHNKLIVADSFGGKLALIDIAGKKVESVRSLPIHNIRGMALDRKYKSLLITHQTLQANGRPSPGDIQAGNLINNHVTRLSLKSVLNPSADLARGQERYPIGDIRAGAGDPFAVAVADDAVFVTIAGVNQFVIGRPKKAVWTRLKVGTRPTALAVDDAKQLAYVANTFGDSISIVDLQKSKVVAEVRLAKQANLSAVQRGEMLFHDARLSFQGWYSCHSCHTDGHTNGRLNDNLTDGTFGTPKRVLSLLGVKDTEKWAWNGQMPSLEKQIAHSLKSTMQGPKPKEKDISDIKAFLRTLQPPPSILQARGTYDEKLIQRGKQVFEKFRCTTCHKPPLYTMPYIYDVGLRDEAGTTKFNPPSLRGISQAGPYFHDNRASSLEDVLGRFRHRLPENASAEDVRLLLYFVRSL